VVEPTGDVDYSRYGVGYAGRRQTDPRIAARLHDALGPARSVVNVGAGAGSYEPTDRTVIAVEPSQAMVAQRAPHLSPAVRAVAGALPLVDGAVDAAMATVSVHQWLDARAGLAEMRRVAQGPVVLLTFDPAALDRLWLAEYCPALYEVESARYPTMDQLVEAMGPDTVVTPVPVPLDCRDGFTEAFYGRPEAFLQPEVRRSQSAWSFVGPADEAAAVERLAADLSSGRWDERHGRLRRQPEFVGALRLLVGPGPASPHGN
jgi:hypothetical protein